MAALPEIASTSEVRERLPAIARAFRERGAAAAPVCFGSHRKPEAVILPAALFERLLPYLQDEGFDLPGATLPRLSAPRGKPRSNRRPKRVRR
jgi:hypothetical protein